jgi:hypothetical protein
LLGRPSKQSSIPAFVGEEALGRHSAADRGEIGDLSPSVGFEAELIRAGHFRAAASSGSTAGRRSSEKNTFRGQRLRGGISHELLIAKRRGTF